MTLPRACLIALLSCLAASAPSRASTAISGVQGISAGYAHACLTTPLGLTRCWGKNGSDGLLGIGSDGPSSLAEPQRVYSAGSVREVSVGNDHACALHTDGTVACWGRNTSGQLGGATGDANSFTALDVPGLSDVQSIAAGGDHTCALLAGGSVKCWGAGEYGQLGNGEASSATPLTVTGVANAVQIAAGGRFSCARLDTGEVSCWGDNLSGQLGRDPASTPGVHSATAAVVANLGGSASDLALGRFHACAIVDGIARCWGENGNHQLGNDDGTAADSYTPVDVVDTTGGTPVALSAIALGMGDSHGCAIRNTGALLCWGAGGNGELGNGSGSDANSPVAVTGFDGITLAAVKVDGGNGYTCARNQRGEARCWGANATDQLGDGTASPSNTPVAVLAPQESMDLVASASTVTLGSALTLTATVYLDEFGQMDLAGATVTFYDGATAIDGCSGLALSGDPATAACSSTLTAGLHDLSADYSGGAFSSPTLAGPIQVRVSAPTPSLHVHSFDFSALPASFGTPLASIFEDTIPNAFLLSAPTPITTHQLIVEDMPVAFDQLQFTAASDNAALFDENSFSFYDGEYLGQTYKAVALRPRVDANGSATITYSVLGPDDQVLATATQAVSVVAVNDPPAAILVLDGASGIAATLINTVAADAAPGSPFSFGVHFNMQGLPGDEESQSLTPSLVRRASSAADPLAAAPQLTGTDAIDMPTTFRATYAAQASGSEGWVRYDARLSDDGDGACFDSGEGTSLFSSLFAQVFTSFWQFLGYLGDPGPDTVALALAKPPAVWIPVQDFVHLAPLPNRCSRSSRLYLAKGDWAFLEVGTAAKSQLDTQLQEILGLSRRGVRKTGGSEKLVYVVGNRGNVPITGARLSVPMPAGVSAMSWQCQLNELPCDTPSGNGGISLTVDLAVGDVAYLLVTAEFDGSRSFVNLRGSASYPPGIQSIEDDAQAMDLILPTNGDALFTGGFER